VLSQRGWWIVTHSKSVSAQDRRWFEEALPSRIETMEEYQQVSGAWARAKRSVSPYHGPDFAERAADLFALFSDFERRSTERAPVADSGEGRAPS